MDTMDTFIVSVIPQAAAAKSTRSRKPRGTSKARASAGATGTQAEGTLPAQQSAAAGETDDQHANTRDVVGPSEQALRVYVPIAYTHTRFI